MSTGRWWATGAAARGRRRVAALAVLVLLAALTGAQPWTAARAGGLDPTFGVGGRVVTDLAMARGLDNPVREWVTTMTLEQDDAVLVAGGYTPATNPRPFLARFTPAGELDRSFGDGGLAQTLPSSPFSSRVGVIERVVVQPDGRILVAGKAHDAGTDMIARFHSDGLLDPTFGSGGTVLLPQQPGSGPYDGRISVALQPDGRIVLADSVLDGGNPRLLVWRLNADGSADGGGPGDTTPGDGFGTGGQVAVPGELVAAATTLGATGNLLVAARQREPAGVAVVSLTSAGVPDPRFGGDGVVFVGLGADVEVGGIQVSTGGEIVVAGSAGSDLVALSLNALDGRPTVGFGRDGVVRLDAGGAESASDLVVQDDRRLLLAGATRTAAGSDVLLARLLPDGRPDVSFAPGGVLVTDFPGGAAAVDSDAAAGVRIGRDGRILTAGTVHSAPLAGQPDIGLARFTGFPEGADLTVSVLPHPSRVALGTRFDYRIRVVNLGPDAATNLRVSYLPTSGSSSVVFGQGSTDSPGRWACNDRDCAIAAIPPGGQVVLTVPAAAVNAGHSDIVVRVRASRPDRNPEDDTVTDRIDVGGADLEVTFAEPAPPLVVGASAELTARITNRGPERATGVSVRLAAAAPAVELVAGQAGGACAGATGTLTCAVADLPPEGTATVTVGLRALASGTTEVTARVAGSPADYAAGNDLARTAVSVLPAPSGSPSPSPTVAPPPADLAVSLTAGAGAPRVGASFRQLVTVVNEGPGAATDLTVDVRVPAEWATSTRVVAVDGPLPAACLPQSSPAGGASAGAWWRCTLPLLEPGGRLSATVELTGLAPGPGGLQVLVSATSVDPDNADNAATVSFPVAVTLGRLVLRPAVARPGQVVVLLGAGFSPQQQLWVRLRDRAPLSPVRTDADGAFRTSVLVLPKTSTGTVVVEVGAGTEPPAEATASEVTQTTLLVVPGLVRPPAFIERD